MRKRVKWNCDPVPYRSSHIRVTSAPFSLELVKFLDILDSPNQSRRCNTAKLNPQIFWDAGWCLFILILSGANIFPCTSRVSGTAWFLCLGCGICLSFLSYFRLLIVQVMRKKIKISVIFCRINRFVLKLRYMLMIPSYSKVIYTRSEVCFLFIKGGKLPITLKKLINYGRDVISI